MPRNKKKDIRQARATNEFFGQLGTAMTSSLPGPASNGAGASATCTHAATATSAESSEKSDEDIIKCLIKLALLSTPGLKPGGDPGILGLVYSLRKAYFTSDCWHVDVTIIREIVRAIRAGEIEHLTTTAAEENQKKEDEITIIATSELLESEVLLLIANFFQRAAEKATVDLSLSPSPAPTQSSFYLTLLGLILATSYVNEPKRAPLLPDDWSEILLTPYINSRPRVKVNVLVSTSSKSAEMSPLTETTKAEGLSDTKELTAKVEGLTIKDAVAGASDTTATSTSNEVKVGGKSAQRTTKHATVEDEEDEPTTSVTVPDPSKKKPFRLLDDDEDEMRASNIRRGTIKKPNDDTIAGGPREHKWFMTAEEAFYPRSQTPRGSQQAPARSGYDDFQPHLPRYQPFPPTQAGYEAFQAHRAAREAKAIQVARAAEAAAAAKAAEAGEVCEAGQVDEAAKDTKATKDTPATKSAPATQGTCAAQTAHFTETGPGAQAKPKRKAARQTAQEAAHAKLVAQLEGLVNRDFPNAQARRAAFVRAKQEILRSETLAAARGTQRMRPTATRATEAVKSVGRDDARRAALQQAGYSFDIGGMAGWAGELERMQIQGLRRSANTAAKKEEGGSDSAAGGGGDATKDKKKDDEDKDEGVRKAKGKGKGKGKDRAA